MQRNIPQSLENSTRVGFLLNTPLVFLVYSPLIWLPVAEFLKENICSPKTLKQLFEKGLFLSLHSALNTAIQMPEQLAADVNSSCKSCLDFFPSFSLSLPSLKKSTFLCKGKETKAEREIWEHHNLQVCLGIMTERDKTDAEFRVK